MKTDQPDPSDPRGLPPGLREGDRGIAGTIGDIAAHVGDEMGGALYGDAWPEVKNRARRQARRRKIAETVGGVIGWTFVAAVSLCFVVLLLCLTVLAVRAVF